MNELLPWLKWLESKGIHACSVEVPLETPAIPLAETDSDQSRGAIDKPATPKPSENLSEAELDLFRTGPYSDWGINE